MSVPPIPAPLEQLGPAPFSFYPPILNVEHNEWRYQRATWTDVQVVNTKTSDELWIPRHFIGEVSLIGDPVMIVGLVKELEYREGVVYPHVRRVIEMPRAVNESPRPRIRAPRTEVPAPVVAIRLESEPRSRTVLGAVALALLGCLAVATIARISAPPRVAPLFSPADDYDSVVGRLGTPATDTWLSSSGFEYRRLWYPRRSIAVILTGDRDHPHYAGLADRSGRVLQSVEPLPRILE